MASEPVPPLPAATLVPMRDGESGLEVLLLRRSERSAFVPGRHVFPGGVVDAGDGSVEVAVLVSGLSPEGAAERLDLRGGDPPGLAYFVAAVRETFEESGLLVGVRDASGAVPSSAGPRIAELRAELLEGRISFADALGRMHARIAGDELVYFAHWITPKDAPRRYDTRFFASRVRCAPSNADVEPTTDGREMTAALWTTPAAALRALEAGTLRMIRPTIETLKHLSAFPDARAALAALATSPVATNLPASSTRDFAADSARARLAEP